MIEDGVAGFGIAQEIDKGNLIVRRTRQRAHDKLEICRREAGPTIRLDHRELIISFNGAKGQG